VSVARFIADQRTFYRVPHTITCALLGVSVSWFYKWIDRTPTAAGVGPPELPLCTPPGW
jgi:putative transposase